MATDKARTSYMASTNELNAEHLIGHEWKQCAEGSPNTTVFIGDLSAAAMHLVFPGPEFSIVLANGATASFT
ncbi:hypothetical protein E4U41_007737, partial [Claviceps citrina]